MDLCATSIKFYSHCFWRTVTRALLTEFLAYDNAIGFSISIYKYLFRAFNTFVEHWHACVRRHERK